jgi:hypothetical protein
MDFDVLPGPSFAELARTTLARATAATVTCARPGAGREPVIAAPAGLADGPAGHPVLRVPAWSRLAQELAAGPCAVTIRVPADPPFGALQLDGLTRPGDEDAAEYLVTVRSVGFTGARAVPVALADYQTAAPDPLWPHAAGVLRHLEHGHMAELVACTRAHGMPEVEWVAPSGLDRYGLRLLVLSAEGVSQARLSFPDGPVTSFSEVPASLRAVLACRCQSSRLGSPPGPDEA